MAFGRTLLAVRRNPFMTGSELASRSSRPVHGRLNISKTLKMRWKAELLTVDVWLSALDYLEEADMQRSLAHKVNMAETHRTVTPTESIPHPTRSIYGLRKYFHTLDLCRRHLSQALLTRVGNGERRRGLLLLDADPPSSPDEISGFSPAIT